ncbi:anti-sigma factor family protein [Streptomyces sp. NPDC051636]|uniref:anti-sigma factor family protein n=1 Tax=Streptomyces sp. NPDC051636 TaxID=3365663 RepID=UPI0037BDA823
MTSTTDTAGHPDVAEISDLTEGLLPPSRTVDVRRHLEDCELCADVHASLEEIRGLLGSLLGPTRMPADVGGRIDAALAAEALLNATAPESANADVTVDTGSSGTGNEPHADAHVSRETSTSADRPAGRPRAATGPGRKDRGRGRRRRIVVLAAVLTVAVLGAGSLFLQSLGTDKPNTIAQHKQTSSTGTFSGSDIKGQVDGMLSTKKNSPRGSESAKTLIQTSVPVPDCVRQGVNGDGDVLGAKTGTYEGKNAFLVVVSDTSDRTRVMAYVIDASCVSGQPGSPGKVLLKESLARP